jgi:hypothetical protein
MFHSPGRGASCELSAEDDAMEPNDRKLGEEFVIMENLPLRMHIITLSMIENHSRLRYAILSVIYP